MAFITTGRSASVLDLIAALTAASDTDPEFNDIPVYFEVNGVSFRITDLDVDRYEGIVRISLSGPDH